MSSTNTESLKEIVDRRTQQILEKEPELLELMVNPDLCNKLNASDMSLDRIIANLLECYADREALAERTYNIEQDKTNSKTIRHYFPSFNSITYSNLHLRIKKIANVWKLNSAYKLAPGDFVCFIGSTGIDHVTVEFSLIYNQISLVPLSGSQKGEELEAIIEQIQPKALVINNKNLKLGANIARQTDSVNFILVVNYDDNVTDERLTFEAVQRELRQHNAGIGLISLQQLLTLGDEKDWEFLPANPKGEQRIARILYTSGSTGSPKGAIYTEKNEKNIWLTQFYPFPVIILFIAPFNHLMGRSTLVATLLRGGIGYFPCKDDLSTIFEDIRIIRPTCLCVFPRICEFIYDHYQNQIKQVSKTRKQDSEIKSTKIMQEMRASFLGNRMVLIEVSGAPMAPQVKQFMVECFDVGVVISYASTESTGALIANDYLIRKNVKDYKLKDVPELGYFRSDKPFPRGEFLVKTVSSIQQYYQNPEATDNLIDKDGFIHTGDIVEDRGNDHVIVIDRMTDVIKLSQGEFVALAPLASLFESYSRIIGQIYIYGNSQYSYLVAVIVPDKQVIREIFGHDYDGQQLKQYIRTELQQVACQAKIKAFEIPKDFIIEMEPFSVKNGLLSSLHKQMRKAFIEKYGDRLEALYQPNGQHHPSDKTMSLPPNSKKTVAEKLVSLIKMNLNQEEVDSKKQLTYAQLGGDSLNAIGLAMAVKEHFGIPFSADILLSPTGSIQVWVDSIVSALKDKQNQVRTFEKIHSPNAKTLKAEDLEINRFLEPSVLEQAKLNGFTEKTKTVLLTGANGFLGRFICLDWLRKLKSQGGKLICLVRAQSDEEAMRRVDDVFIGKDQALEQTYMSLKPHCLDVIAGDVSQRHFGLNEIDYQHLAEKVDRVVHVAALVSHILSYEHLFTTNVAGTAEVIRFSLTHSNKAIDYISSVAIEPHLQSSGMVYEYSPLKKEIQLSEDYASGYAASKWASEHLLHNSSEKMGLTINIFRSNMLLSHQIYQGQINTRDFFTRLLYSLLLTGIAPKSFYTSKTKPGHYDGLPVNTASTCIVEAGNSYHQTCQTYTIQNYHEDDGCSLDAFVDWIIKAGYPIQKINDYQQWLQEFKQKLEQLDKSKQQNSVLMLLQALTHPQNSEKSLSNCDNFRKLIRQSDPPIHIPHLNEAFILKCIDDMKRHHLLKD